MISIDWLWQSKEAWLSCRASLFHNKVKKLQCFLSVLGFFLPQKCRFSKKLLTFHFYALNLRPALLSSVFPFFLIIPFPIGFSDDFRGYFWWMVFGCFGVFCLLWNGFWCCYFRWLFASLGGLLRFGGFFYRLPLALRVLFVFGCVF